jgi:hypothetical protein
MSKPPILNKICNAIGFTVGFGTATLSYKHLRNSLSSADQDDPVLDSQRDCAHPRDPSRSDNTPCAHGSTVPIVQSAESGCRASKTIARIAARGWRMRAHCENALAVAGFLQRHPALERVYYPELKDHPGHDIACRQMSGLGQHVVRPSAWRPRVTCACLRVPPPRESTQPHRAPGFDRRFRHQNTAKLAAHLDRVLRTLLELDRGVQTVHPSNLR